MNGHAFPEVDRLKIDIHYRERAILYRNERGRFVDISENAGPGIREPHASRGAAFADYDNDGGVEVVVNNQNEPPSLLRQPSRGTNHWLTLKLEGVKANRSAIGARVKIIGRFAGADRGSAERRELSVAERSAIALRAGDPA